MNEQETEEVGPVTQILKAIITAIISAIGIGLAALAIMWTVGCATQQDTVHKSLNNYEFYSARFAEVCPDPPVTDPCKVKASVLIKWSGALDEASACLKPPRGGKFPLQLKRLSETEKEYPK